MSSLFSFLTINSSYFYVIKKGYLITDLMAEIISVHFLSFSFFLVDLGA